MNESPRELLVNPTDEDDDEPTSMESFQLKVLTNQTEKSSHSNQKEKPAQGSNRALLALVIIVCLISLVALLLTLLMLVGKIGSSNEGSYAVSAKSLQTYLAKIKALEENMTSLQLGLRDAGYNALRDDLNMTRNQLLTMSDKVTKDTLVAVNTTLALRAKPSAHIVSSSDSDDRRTKKDYPSDTVITHWSANDSHSHLEDGMKYENGSLVVPKAGRYYIYAHLKFASEGKVRILVNNKQFVCLITSPVTQANQEATANGNGVFVLNAGDSISLRIHNVGMPDDGSVKFWMRYNLCYFGAFLI